LTEDALALFCRRVGSNLQEVHGELTKLFAYLGERTLADAADVAAVVSDTRVDSIFDLTNALGGREKGRRSGFWLDCSMKGGSAGAADHDGAALPSALENS
jgi:hypothetical protein